MKLHMNMILNAFKSASRSAPSVSRNDREIQKRLVSKMADGNVSLQLGRYATKEEIDSRRDRVCKHIYAK